jgi:hypothetical protein
MSSLLGLASISYFSRILFGKLSIPTRIYYVLVIAVNLLLISVSGSIQGIGVFAAGAVLVLAFFIRENKSLSASLAFLFASTSTGVIGLLGTASVGPLKSIGQETVTFRLDYWKAAIKMTLENPWYGVGLDSYGDFYRLYRDEAAILRTGPQRVTNTAHNIFLDVSSGAGLFSLLLFTTLFLVAFYIVGRALIQNSFDKDSITWAALSLGFAVFCLISINQIGVGIWGFIGIGIIIGTGKEVFQQREVLDASHKVLSKSRIKQGSKNKNKFSYNTSKSSGEGWTFTRRLPKFLESTQLLCAVFIMVIAGQQVFIDSLLLKSLRTGDFESAYKISFSQSAHDQQRDITIAKLKDSKREIPALNLARRATEINPRNWDAWVFIISSNLSTDEEKKTAAETLLELDPKNNLVREELSSLFP